ncbi:MAG: hypothetical protein MUE41_03000, partial [Gemmatimonadaceae bacterium]|nr:hypothetical protein [Gemmatimonadaceae bacterium]
TCPNAVVISASPQRQFVGVQFHPEVTHTPHGVDLLRNFVYDICQCKGGWRMSDFAIRHLADATELLTVAVIRRTLPDVSGTIRLHLTAARSALAGDHGLDLLLAWLQASGLTLASGVTAQLDLPGL